MATYTLFFNSPQGRVGDPKGIQLVHLGRLHDSVTKVAKDLIGGDPAAAEWTFEVHDEAGRTILSDKLGKFVTSSAPEQ